MSSKRPRTPPSLSSVPESLPLEALEPATKSKRTAPSRSSSSAHPLLCTLPPTCNPPNRPTFLANSKELETHYATYHAHVCEEGSCGCVFPDARLLELHQTECHDPIAALRKEKGEKIFACHLASCSRVFSTPKTRRLHLIQAHGYPKEYFFAVTNKGVGGLLKKWGEGASMVRGTWNTREREEGQEETAEKNHEDHDDSEEKEETEEEDKASADSLNEYIQPDDGAAALGHPWNDGPLIEDEDDDEIGLKPEQSVDDLATSMDTLSLVPTAIRFGRGAKRGGSSHHQHPSGPRRGHPHPHTSQRADASTTMEVDNDEGVHGEHHNPRGRGRGSRRGGRGDITEGAARRARPPMMPRGLGIAYRGSHMGRGRIALGIARGGEARGRGQR